ncbi:TetR/AcrR family transcriptional regulator [Streptomyces venezuelae]|uniref:TetR/AcrR family transcriptional regulator n=1 Tax=Streptomyces venezuelae TaxID=54571 RepID=UPI00123B9BD3|nr:TetR/AcrR family transcriptional regulator [Streptomyces venezuelae]QES09584.1 TetR/AcrR family transcriptional regulator [Streptomyces venezuelae]
MTSSAKPGPRERLLLAAQELTYTDGVGVGVDALLKAAGVARRSLYEHFGGKEGLIAEVLRRSTAEDVAEYRATMEAAGDDPRARLLAVIDRLGRIAAGPDFHGCRYLAADLALTDPEHPGHDVTRAYRRTLHGLFTDELTALGHSRPGFAADQLLILVDGLLATGAARPEDRPPAVAVRELAEHIVDAGPPPAAATTDPRGSGPHHKMTL